MAHMLVFCMLMMAVGVDFAHTRATATMKNKLLYIMVDGFRWDYVDLQKPEDLPGLTKFLSEGVRARWTNPLFPALSYPTWTSLVTGQYAETHGIVGNYFYDAEMKDYFSLFDVDSTGKEKWWTSEPIWTTAEKSGMKTAQYLWARCDVPIDGFTTDYCERFVKIPGKEIFLKNIMKALENLDNGFDFVQVYTEHTDHTGHNYGPDSNEMVQAVRDVDDVLKTLQEELDMRNLTDKVNIVIVSDHGMSYTAPGAVERHEIDDYLDVGLVESIADKGAFMSIKLRDPEENLQKVHEQLLKIPGVNVYKHDEIPAHFHFKNNKYIHDFILLAQEGNFIMASRSHKQVPRRSDFVFIGAHGFDPDVQNMKGIFFAKGPDFKKNLVIDPIHIVDVYQVLTHVLHLTPNPHNGTWSRVKPALVNPNPQGDSSQARPSPGLTVIICMAYFFWRILF